MAYNSAYRMNDGFSTIYSFAQTPLAKMWEIEVTPPDTSIKSIDTSTMRNARYKTMAPASLIETGKMSATVAFASEAISQITTQIGVIQLITITFPDNSTYQFYGFLESFTPGKFTEGAMPTATVSIVRGNTNAAGVETAPIYTSSSGVATPVS